MKNILLAIVFSVAAGLGGLQASEATAPKKGPNCAKCCGEGADACKNCCGDNCADCEGCK